MPNLTKITTKNERASLPRRQSVRRLLGEGWVIIDNLERDLQLSEEVKKVSPKESELLLYKAEASIAYLEQVHRLVSLYA